VVFQGLFKTERRKDGRQVLGEHSFARARRPDHEHVMAAGGGHFKSPLGGLLSAKIGEVERKVLLLAEELRRRGSVQQLAHFVEAFDRINVDSLDYGGFPRIGFGDHQIPAAARKRRDGHG